VEKVDFIIVTGMSGAGKSEAMDILEDLGYFCVDNLPPALIGKFAELATHSAEVNQAALVIDIRGRDFFDSFFEELSKLEAESFSYRILFLEASTDVLINRFKKTRRRHPLAPEGRISEAIKVEREKLEEIRGAADKIIDTTDLNPKDLKTEIKENFVGYATEEELTLSFLSFGFKYGVPLDADLMFDVRFLPNPHYVDSLRSLTGQEKKVQDYVLKWPITRQFRDKLFDLINFLLPHYVKEGKSHLTVAIGCTGGKHRSVTLVEKLYDEFNGRYQALKEHRDRNK